MKISKYTSNRISTAFVKSDQIFSFKTNSYSRRMLSKSYLSTIIVITILYISVVSADFCSDQTNPETIFSIGENIYINSEDNKLWLLKRNKSGYSVFTEVNIAETFGERFSRVSHALHIYPVSCDHNYQNKIENLVIVIGRDKQNKSVYSTFKLIDKETERELIKPSNGYLPEDWGLIPDGDFDSNSNRFWRHIDSSVVINNFFYTPQTMFVTLVSDPETILRKCIDSNCSISLDWVTDKYSKLKSGGESIFPYEGYLYGIKKLDDNEVVLHSKYNLTATCYVSGYNGLNTHDGSLENFEKNIRKMFGCKPRTSSNNPSEIPESYESTTNRSEPSSNTTLIIIIILIILLMILIIIIIFFVWLCLNKKSLSKPENVKSIKTNENK